MLSRVGGPAAAVAAAIAVAGCVSGHSTKAPVFQPSGTIKPATTATTASAAQPRASAAAVTMPPFGKNVRILMTSWLPRNQAQAHAVLADKNFELAYLYAEYTSGNDSSWASYVTPDLATELQSALARPDVTTESFTGTIRFFRMSVIPDPSVRGDFDVSACFDNSKSSNTNARTGKALPDTTPNKHYIRITDQLGKNSAGEWQVVSNLPATFYAQAKECKP